MSKDDKKRPDGEITSRRELLAATAKLSAFIGAMGLTGIGVTGSAAADSAKSFPKVEMKRDQKLLPAVQKRELRAVLQDSMRTGNPRAALKRHPNLKLTRQQEASLMRISKQEWAALRSAQSKLGSLKNQFADDTGVIIY
jgi:hypothetical protein